MADENCVICLDNLTPTNSASIDSCRHLYHIICIQAWGKISSQCPLCKKEFSKIKSEGGDEIPIEKKKFKGGGAITWDEEDFEGRDWLCQVCGSGAHEEVLLICEQCEKCCHTYCVDLDEVPEEPFICTFCQLPTVADPPSAEPRVNPVALTSLTSTSSNRALSSSCTSIPHCQIPQPPQRSLQRLAAFPVTPKAAPHPTRTKPKPPACPRHSDRRRFELHRIHILIKRRMAREGINVSSMTSPLTKRVIPKSDGIIEQSTIDQLIGLCPRVERNPWVYKKERKHSPVVNPLQNGPTLNDYRSQSRSRSTSPIDFPFIKRRKLCINMLSEADVISSPNRLLNCQTEKSSKRNCLPLQLSPPTPSLLSPPSQICSSPQPSLQRRDVRPAPTIKTRALENLNSADRQLSMPLGLVLTPQQPKLSSDEHKLRRTCKRTCVRKVTSEKGQARPSTSNTHQEIKESRTRNLKELVARKVKTIVKKMRTSKYPQMTDEQYKLITFKATRHVYERLKSKKEGDPIRRLKRREEKIVNLCLSYGSNLIKS